MDIRMATDVDQTPWDNYVLRHSESLAYHRYAWKKAVYDAYHFKAVYLIAEQGERICGVLPLIDFNRPLLGRSYVSLPYCDLGGCLADDLATEQALIDYARMLAAQTGVEHILLRQKSNDHGSGSSVCENEKVRMLLNLPANSALLLEGLKSKLRSQIRKPIRDGLTARLGGVELVPEFYSVFARNMRVVGSPVHSKKWVEVVIRHYMDKARVGLVYNPKGAPIAGGIILLHRKMVSIPWASSLRKFNRLNPNMLLYWTFLSFAADQGFEVFDFGRSTPGSGTYRFKEQWGARPEALVWRELGPGGGTEQARGNDADVRQKLAKIWSRMPLVVCNVIGPLVRRNISL